MRKLFLAVIIVVTVSTVAIAQETSGTAVVRTAPRTVTVADRSSDRFKIGGYFTESSDVTFINPANILRGPKGLTLEGDARVARFGALRIGGVVNFNRANIDKEGQDPVDRYGFGPRFSVDVLKKGNFSLSPFGHVLVGFRTSYNPNDRVFSRAYGFGADVNLGNIYIRPFGLDIVRESDVIDMQGSTANQKRLTFGGGFRF